MIQFDVDKEELTEIAPDLTPMLDIIFILLVFFLLTENSAELALVLDLPQEGVEQATTLNPSKKIRLIIFKQENHWEVDGTPYSEWAIAQQAIISGLKGKTDTEIIVAGNRQVPMERLLQVRAFLKQQNLKTTQILMKEKTSEFSKG